MSPTLGGAFMPADPPNLTGTPSESGVVRLYGATAPLSGVTGVGTATRGSMYLHTENYVWYINERDATTPYWTPYGADMHPNLLSWTTDFRDGIGKALADTAASVTLAGSGLRIFGQGIAETDSGVVVTQAENGPVARLTTTDEDAHLVALSFGCTDSSALPLQPDTNGPLIIEATCGMVSALTLRRFFIGFLGTAADALDPPATGATTTITLVQDDLGGLFFDAGLTAATTLCSIWNNADGAASQTVAATTTSTTMIAAGSALRFRVEIARNGTMRCFRNRVLIATVPAAVDVTEEFAPVLLVGSTSAAVKSMDVYRLAAWGTRD